VGKLEAIWKKRARRGPMDPVERVRLVAGEGIVGNADYRAQRQVTLLALEGWRAAEAALGRGVDPRARRANLLVSGVDLAGGRGRVLAVGPVRLRLRGETTPCDRMDEACPGLRAALASDWRAGAWADVLDDGEIALGDRVEWVAPAAGSPPAP
jgi:MOSC domain-containing protein YiiM